MSCFVVALCHVWHLGNPRLWFGSGLKQRVRLYTRALYGSDSAMATLGQVLQQMVATQQHSKRLQTKFMQLVVQQAQPAPQAANTKHQQRKPRPADRRPLWSWRSADVAREHEKYRKWMAKCTNLIATKSKASLSWLHWAEKRTENITDSDIELSFDDHASAAKGLRPHPGPGLGGCPVGGGHQRS